MPWEYATRDSLEISIHPFVASPLMGEFPVTNSPQCVIRPTVTVTVTGERRSSFYLFQRISIAIQRGNAASVLGTVGSTSKLDEIFYL